MTETDQQGAPGNSSFHGVDTDNLRNYERLHRSSTDRRIAGVCGGLGRHLNVDPTVVRVLFVVLALFGGAGLLLYLVAWFIVPEDDHPHAIVHLNPQTRNAVLLIAAAVAAVVLLGNSWHWWFPWPLAVVGLIVLAIVATRRPSGTSAPTAPAAPTAPTGPTGPGSGGPAGSDDWPPPAVPAAAGAYAAYAVTDTTTDATATTAGGAGAPPTGRTGWTVPPYRPPARPARRGPVLFGYTLAIIAIACGLLGLYDIGAGHSVLPSAYPAVALTVIGVMLVVGAFVGRPGGLIALGVVTAMLLGVTSVLPADANWTHSRTVVFSPSSTELVKPSYFNSVGQTTLNLSRVRDLSSLDGRTITVRGRVGDLRVIVPSSMTADVTASVQVGSIQIGARSSDGTNVHAHAVLGNTGPRVFLDLQMYAGQITVQQGVLR